jgi:hypothetical protein
MKFSLFIAIFFLSFSLFAGEMKIIEIGSKDLFTYERIEPELIFNPETLEAGVNVKLSSSYLSEYLPRDNQVILKEMFFDHETGEILLKLKNKEIVCGHVRKKKNGLFAKWVGLTGDCKFDQRYKEKTTRVDDILSRVQLLEIYLIY